MKAAERYPDSVHPFDGGPFNHHMQKTRGDGFLVVQCAVKMDLGADRGPSVRHVLDRFYALVGNIHVQVAPPDGSGPTCSCEGVTEVTVRIGGSIALCGHPSAVKEATAVQPIPILALSYHQTTVDARFNCDACRERPPDLLLTYDGARVPRRVDDLLQLTEQRDWVVDAHRSGNALLAAQCDGIIRLYLCKAATEAGAEATITYCSCPVSRALRDEIGEGCDGCHTMIAGGLALPSAPRIVDSCVHSNPMGG